MRPFHHLIPPDHHAFAEFHEKHLAKISTYLDVLGVHPSDTGDVTQLVVMKVYNHFDQVPGAEGVENWLFRICCQQAATYYGRAYRRRERPEPNVGVDIPGEDEAILHERRERAKRVEQVLEDMDPMLAEVLVRHEVLGQTLPTIAAELHISRATAQRRLSDAKMRFERRIAPFLAATTPTKRRRMALLPIGLVSFLRTENNSAQDGANSEGPAGAHGRATAPASDNPPGPGWTGMVKAMLLHPFRSPGTLGVGIIAGAVGGFVAGTVLASDGPMPAEHANPVVVAVALEPAQGHAEATPGGPSVSPPGAMRAAVPTSGSAAAPQVPSRPRSAITDRGLLEQASIEVDEGRFDDAMTTLQQHQLAYPNSQFVTLRGRITTRARGGLERRKAQLGDAVSR